ncbi:U8 snoRNA-decapping enzyme [Chanos chanos]|uniref:U8 snoRNA-decapping enzyme n=1 Tax=Chanos chanos TaxID=29144 RepID=A0A6J2V1D7_CHACN|nr:U8 snoRNA-decapping enzyme-like [Chanos chanos]
MATEEITREDALSRVGYRHACHIMLYADTTAKLFRKIPIKHVVLMQMRFDGFFGFPGGLVNPLEETLEVGLSRELKEEVGVAIPVSEEDHLSSCLHQSPSHIITHFYAKKLEESELRDIEKAAVATADDHGLEVMGMVRVPLYFLKDGGGLPRFLSHSFISNCRSQLLFALRHLGLVSKEELERAKKQADRLRHATNCQ